MQIIIEFYGIVRRRTETAQTAIAFAEDDVSLSTVFEQLVERYPALEPDCIQTMPGGDFRLEKHLIANVDGRRFTRDSTERLHDGQHLLLLSADVGG